MTATTALSVPGSREPDHRRRPQVDARGTVNSRAGSASGEMLDGSGRRSTPWAGIIDFCDLVEELITGNEIFNVRTRGIGLLPADVRMSYGAFGANIRASGVDWDHRRDTPSPLVYDELDWQVWTHPDGDCFARYWVRLREVREAAKMVQQLCAGLPGGPIMAKVPRIIKVPPGEAWVAVEAPLGEMGFYVISKDDLVPFRVKIRSASFNNISVLPWLLRGAYVPNCHRHPCLPLLHPGGHRPVTHADAIPDEAAWRLC